MATSLASHDLSGLSSLSILWGKVVRIGAGQGIGSSSTTWYKFPIENVNYYYIKVSL